MLILIIFIALLTYGIGYEQGKSDEMIRTGKLLEAYLRRLQSIKSSLDKFSKEG